MADRRMFAKTITDSDAFSEMPLSTQALYFHMGMQADDDGFINAPKRIQKSIGASDEDLELLKEKNFIIPFDSGIVVLKHWKINNYIRGDRKKDTAYPDEMSKLTTKENGAYTVLVGTCQANDGQVTGNRLSSDSIGKDRIGKDSIDKSSSSLGGNDKLINRLSEDESEYLFKLYQDADYLIDEVQAEVDKRKRKIEKPFQYIVGYAEKKGWPENGD